jgi:hypothetical protein
MYTNIIIDCDVPFDPVFIQQIKMLKERHKANLIVCDSDDAKRKEWCLGSCEDLIDDYHALDMMIDEYDPKLTLFISDTQEQVANFKEKGFSTNSPVEMKKAYDKAVELMKTLVSKPQ